MNAQELKELLDSGGELECNGWSIWKINNMYIQSCECCAWYEYSTFEELYNSLSSYKFEAWDADGNRIL